jgi:transcriptional regulator with XRE-family HTH domain
LYDILNIVEGVFMYFKRLKDLREDKDLLQKDIAKKLGISQQYYSQYELGNYTMPIEMLIELAKEYNVSIDYLVGLSDKKK